MPWHFDERSTTRPYSIRLCADFGEHEFSMVYIYFDDGETDDEIERLGGMHTAYRVLNARHATAMIADLDALYEQYQRADAENHNRLWAEDSMQWAEYYSMCC